MIGSMKYRIILNNPKRAANGRGGWSIDYKSGDKMEVWAAAEVMNITKRLQYSKIDEQSSLLFLVRANPFIRQDTRITFNGQEFIITSYAPADNPHFYEISAREAET